MSDEDQVLGTELQGNTDDGAGGTDEGNVSWVDSTLSESYRTEEFRQFASPDDMAKRLVELQSSVVQPPETADGYTVNVPQGHPVDQEFVDSFKSWAHKAGLSDGQFQTISAEYVGFETEFAKKVLKNEADHVESLKHEWGDKFAENVVNADKALKAVSDPESIKWLKETRLANSPVFIRMFHKIWEKIGPDTILTDESTRATEPERTESGTPMMSYPSMAKK
jgi:hypothetical protein